LRDGADRKGHISLANFKAFRSKIGSTYFLTPSGIMHRLKLTVRFIKRKLAQYEAIRSELDQLRTEFSEDVRD
jgi:hypothetical protein